MAGPQRGNVPGGDETAEITTATVMAAYDLLLRRDLAAAAEAFGAGETARGLRALTPIRSVDDMRAQADEITRALGYGHSWFSRGRNRGTGHHDIEGQEFPPDHPRMRRYVMSHAGVTILTLIDRGPGPFAATSWDAAESVQDVFHRVIRTVHRRLRNADDEYLHSGTFLYSADAATAHSLTLLAEVSAPGFAPPAPLDAGVMEPDSGDSVVAEAGEASGGTVGLAEDVVWRWPGTPGAGPVGNEYSIAGAKLLGDRDRSRRLISPRRASGGVEAAAALAAEQAHKKGGATLG